MAAAFPKEVGDHLDCPVCFTVPQPGEFRQVQFKFLNFSVNTKQCLVFTESYCSLNI